MDKDPTNPPPSLMFVAEHGGTRRIYSVGVGSCHDKIEPKQHATGPENYPEKFIRVRELALYSEMEKQVLNCGWENSILYACNFRDCTPVVRRLRR